MAELEDRLERLEIELAALKACITDPPSRASQHLPAGLPESDFPEIYQLTATLFPGTISFAPIEDPEIPNDVRVVFNVTASGSIDEIVAREAEWHSKLFEIGLESPSLYCLSIDTR